MTSNRRAAGALPGSWCSNSWSGLGAAADWEPRFDQAQPTNSRRSLNWSSASAVFPEQSPMALARLRLESHERHTPSSLLGSAATMHRKGSIATPG
jgi:hypothetical protein